MGTEYEFVTRDLETAVEGVVEWRTTTGRKLHRTGKEVIRRVVVFADKWRDQLGGPEPENVLELIEVEEVGVSAAAAVETVWGIPEAPPAPVALLVLAVEVCGRYELGIGAGVAMGAGEVRPGVGSIGIILVVVLLWGTRNRKAARQLLRRGRGGGSYPTDRNYRILHGNPCEFLAGLFLLQTTLSTYPFRPSSWHKM